MNLIYFTMHMIKKSVVNVAFKSASYNIILQVLMRIISSLSNAVILRYITTDALGVINVRLMLLYSTALCLSREAFRRSCMSHFDSKHPKKTFNLIWITVPVCLMCCSILRILWLYFLEIPDTTIAPYYSVGVNVVTLSVFIEVLAEPLYIFSQSYHFVKLKVVIEGISLTTKSICMVALLNKWPDHVIYIFCFSQVLCSSLYVIAYYTYFFWYLKQKSKSSFELPINSLCEILPEFSKNFVDWKDVYLTWSFFKQTMLKQLLTEGERYTMTIFSILNFAEQGVYDVVNNLGSLAARFIFLPIEDSGYLLFTSLIIRDQPHNKQENRSVCLHVLENLMKIMVLLGLIILTFGYSFSQMLLQLYGGSILSSGMALTLLRWHCFYVLLLAINGITECFKFASISRYEIDRYNKKMVFLSVSFLFAAYYLAKLWGGVGFIMANCLNMGFRIIHSVHFILNYFEVPKSWLIKNVIPKPKVLLVMTVSFFLTSISEIYFCCENGLKLWILHLFVGILCFGILLSVIYMSERTLVRFINEQWRHQSSAMNEKIQ